jgi:uncharacterized protein
MEFQTVRASQSFFTRYSTEGFIFGERTYQGSLLILPDELPMELAEAESDYLCILSYSERLRRSESEVILIGTGRSLVFPSVKERQELHRQSLLNLEWMDTPAACRTYNVLLGEGRRVTAFLRQCI